MFVNKLKLVSTIILMLAALIGTGASAYYLRAQDPPKPEEPSERSNEAAAPAKNPLDKTDERLQKLLKERCEKAELERNIRYELYRAGANEPGNGNPVTLHLAIDAAKHLLKAELELSKNKEERLEARERHLKVIKEIVKISDAQFKVGRIMRGALVSAQYEELDAEIELEHEKARK